MTAYNGPRIPDRGYGPIYYDGTRGVPTPLAGEQVVYIFAASNGVVKVGQTIDFATRNGAVRSNKRVQGSRPVCFWRAGSQTPDQDEAFLMGICRELGGANLGRTREWFTGVDVHEVIARAEERFGKPDRSKWFPEARRAS